jgi:hypothetical protein
MPTRRSIVHRFGETVRNAEEAHYLTTKNTKSKKWYQRKNCAGPCHVHDVIMAASGPAPVAGPL